MKLRLLKLLQGRSGQWVVMEALCRELVARPEQISKAMDEIRGHGFHIELSPVDGYRYVVTAEPLWTELLRPSDCQRLARQIKLVQTTSSTNDSAREAGDDPANDGLVIFAEFQTAGRGRQGTSWISPAGGNLLFSVLLFDQGGQLKPHLLTLAAGLALADAVVEVTGIEAKLKWPNDLLIDSQKAAGILVEACSDSKGGAVLIIGVGLNCNCPVDELPANAISLRQAGGQLVDRHGLARSILGQLESWIDCCQSEGEGHIRQTFLQRSDLLGRDVRLSCQGRRYSGRVVDLDPFEGILVQLDHGGVRLFSAATTSLLS